MQDRIAAEVQKVVALAQAGAPVMERNEAVKPLMQLLVKTKYIPDMECPVEWQGAWEHGLIAIYWFDDVDDLSSAEHWINVNPDGSIDEF